MIGGPPRRDTPIITFPSRLPNEPAAPQSETDTHYGEVHDLEDPDGEREVDQDKDHEEEDEEVKATFPPAVDAHFVHVRFLGALDIVPMSELFLGHLQRRIQKKKTNIRDQRDVSDGSGVQTIGPYVTGV